MAESAFNLENIQEFTINKQIEVIISVLETLNHRVNSIETQNLSINSVLTKLAQKLDQVDKKLDQKADKDQINKLETKIDGIREFLETTLVERIKPSMDERIENHEQRMHD